MDGLINDQVAVVGMGCRFAGGANNPDLYWGLIKNGKDVITEIPKERWDAEKNYDPDKDALGKVYTKFGGFLPEIDKFDNNFFKISAIEAESLDPQTRLLLELSYEAIEDGGIIVDELKGSKTGVYIGISTIDYLKKGIRSHDATVINPYSITGTLAASASGRISFAYDLIGPSISVDTACSSSLVAVHLAVKSLLSGETDLCITGGVHLMLSPEYHIGYCKLGALSSDGHCKAFDANANGFVRSEGGGVIILKRLSEAIRDGNNVLGVILGSALNNDGNNKGYTAPNPVSQEKLIRDALVSSRITSDEVSYIETHGTGTKVGDPVELQALGNIFRNRPKGHDNLIIGSVKTIIGHAEAAAGMAGLIKILLGLKNQMIPANDHFFNPNPEINWNELPITVASTNLNWTKNTKPRIAGVSSFGLSGTNAHVIIKESPLITKDAKGTRNESPGQVIILPLSAKNREALLALVSEYIQILKKLDLAEISQLAENAALKRSHFEYRFVATSKTKNGLIADLEGFVDGKSALVERTTKKKIAFVFPGQGSQWVGMGLDLLGSEQVFRDSILECDRVLRDYVEWSLLEELHKEKKKSRFEDVEVIQPIIFAIQVSLAKLWQSFGVIPDLLIGHSMGEVAASFIAGVLSLDDAIRIITLRSSLAKTLSGKGAMAVAELSIKEAEEVIKEYKKDISIGASNAPKSVILSGDADAINTILKKLESDNIFCRAIKVDFASHSSQIDLIKDELRKGLECIRPEESLIPIYSTVYDRFYDGNNFNADYWCDNIRKPVLFSQAIQSCIGKEDTVFIEISSHPVLSAFIEQCIEHDKESVSLKEKKNCNVIGSLKREISEGVELRTNFCALYTHGVAIDWKKFYINYSDVDCVKLPKYPWQRESFWLNDSRNFNVSEEYSHAFLKNHLKYVSDSKVHIWSFNIGLDITPFLKDHVVNEVVVFPAAAFIELIQSALLEIQLSDTYQIQDIQFKQPLVLLDGSIKNIQLSIELDDSLSKFKLISAATGNSKENDLLEHLAGTLVFRPSVNDIRKNEFVESKTYLKFEDFVTGNEHYSFCRQRSLYYGQQFRGVSGIWINDKCAVGEVEIESSKVNRNDFIIHPAILDCCLQIALNTIAVDGDTVVPGLVEKIVFNHDVKLGDKLYVQCEWESNDKDIHEEYYSRDLCICNEQGDIFISLKGLKLNKLKNNSFNDNIGDSIYTQVWKKYTSIPELPTNNGENYRYLIFLPANPLGTVLLEQLKKDKLFYVTIINGGKYLKEENENGISYTIRGGEADDHKCVLDDLNSSFDLRFDRILYLWGTDQPDIQSTSLNFQDDFACIGITYFLQELSKYTLHSNPRLFVVTSGVQKVLKEDQHINLEQSPLWGLSRVIYHEFNGLNCTRIDLSADLDSMELANLMKLTKAALNETEIAIRRRDVYCARIEKVTHFEVPEAGIPDTRDTYIKDVPYMVSIDKTGLFDDLIIKEVKYDELKQGEVEVEIKASGLNFMNVMSALGIYPGYKNGFRSLGLEFSGVITRIHESVSGFSIGEEVLGCGENCLAKYVIVSPDLIVKKPKWISFEEASTIPIAFLTAYLSLIVKGQLKKGESVLIHSASGGVGLAAIQIARAAGAKVFATAGTDEKRAFLRTLGVELVMDSRSISFSNQIREYNNGEGVDIVLNSLTGEAMQQSIKLLNPFGRFLEIGKKDIYTNSRINLNLFKNSIAYIFIDLDELIRKRSGQVKNLLSEILEKFDTKTFMPLKKSVFPIAKVVEGFEYMATGKHLGKIVFSMDRDKDLLIKPIGKSKKIFDDNDKILITGGLGGLGLQLTKWFIGNGLKNIVLLSRSGAGQQLPTIIENYKTEGINIEVKSVDVGNFDELKIVFEDANKHLPITGIFHLAGILEDVSLLKLDVHKFHKVVRPKIHGSWNLHLLSKNENIKWFVLYSSAATLLGSSGQGNYVAGNSFMDTLCRYRIINKLPARSINWGPVAEVGLAAQKNNRGQRLELEGLRNFSLKEHDEIVEMLFNGKENQFAAMKLDIFKWSSYNPSYLKESFFYDLLANKNTVVENNSFRDKLLSAETIDTSLHLLKEFLKDTICSVLKMNKPKIDADMPFVSLGMDSLMAIQFRNRLERELGMTISVTVFWNYPSVNLLTKYLATELGIDNSLVPVLDKGIINVDEIDCLTIEELNAELDRELNDIE